MPWTNTTQVFFKHAFSSLEQSRNYELKVKFMQFDNLDFTIIRTRPTLQCKYPVRLNLSAESKAHFYGYDN